MKSSPESRCAAFDLHPVAAGQQDGQYDQGRGDLTNDGDPGDVDGRLPLHLAGVCHYPGPRGLAGEAESSVGLMGFTALGAA